MAILDFQKPDKVIMIEQNNFSGRFEFRPLEPGYGITIGNALRRILLSSLEGYAITSIKIDGVDHEFSTISGVIEDVPRIILNLKQIRFKQLSEESENERFVINISGKNAFMAGDLNDFMSDFEVLNPDLLICTMEKDVRLQMDITVEKGRGYVGGEDHDIDTSEIGLIAVDSIFTPIKNVKYTIENYRVGQKTDYEKLIFDIDSDGSITPKDALKEAAKILIHHFMLFSDEKITLDSEEKKENEEFDEEILHMRQQLKTQLVDLDLSVRALNCLKAADVDTLGELVVYNKNDLLKFRNFGKKSLTEIEELLDNRGLSFGMDVSKYKLDKE
ncbi:MAG: DNA-directed RNA polymerase subunit alpha [Bacteroidetes bacterium]|nr:MAG: DNA-directed RNA polymerase subunit alpha [Bacteroidota bacterium]